MRTDTFDVPKIVSPDINAARVSKDGALLSCSVSHGTVLSITLLDVRTDKPIVGATAKSVDIEYGGNQQSMVLLSEDSPYDLPYPAPDWVLRYGPKEEKQLKSVRKEIDECKQLAESNAKSLHETDRKIQELEKQVKRNRVLPTAKKQELKTLYPKRAAIVAKRKAVAERLKPLQKKSDALVIHRFARREWVAYLQSALLCLGRYDGPLDGIMTSSFSKTLVAEAKKLTGKYRYKTVASDLYKKIQGKFTTTEKGVLTIPLPPGETGSVKIEMAQFKILHPDNAELGTGPTRVDWDAKLGEAGDLPDSTEEFSGWKAVRDGNPAQFQNHITVPFDTTDLIPCIQRPLTYRTYGLVYCQPAWLKVETGDYWLSPPDKVDNFGDGRGLQDDCPTLLVSASQTSTGKDYGVWGNEGRRYYSPQYAKLRKKIGGKWYTWAGKNVEEKVLDSKKEARAWRKKTYPKKVDRLERRVALKKAKKVAKDGKAAESKKKDQWVVQRYREFKEHANRDAADALISTGIGGTKRYIEKDDSTGQWWVKRPTEKGSIDEIDGPFDTLKAAKKEFRKKFHHGIDIAGNVGDPVFAICGGTCKRRAQKKKGKLTGGGRYVNVYHWLKNEVHVSQYLHLDAYRCETGQIIKAGAILGDMGRTGNPLPVSPTHVHVQFRHKLVKTKKGRGFRKSVPMTSPALPAHTVVIPHNGLPRLLPCEADFGAENNDNVKKCARQCGQKIEANQSENNVSANCWAWQRNECPYQEGHVFVEIDLDPPVCPDPTENFPYRSEVFDYVKTIRKLVLNYSKEYDVPPIAVAGSIADEFNEREGKKAVVDEIQDEVILKYAPDWMINLTDWASDYKALDFSRYDIGKGNINVDTAWQVYQQNRDKFKPDQQAWFRDDVAEYVLTDEGTVQIAALYIREAKDLVAEEVEDFDACRQEAVLVTYYKQGPKYLKRFEQSKQSRAKAQENNPALPTHRLSPGEGCRVCRQTKKFKEVLLDGPAVEIKAPFPCSDD